MREVQPADPRARRWAVLLVLCGTLAGLVVIWFVKSFGPVLQAWLLSGTEQIRFRVTAAFTAIAAVVAVPVFCLAIYFWQLGRRIVRAEQFPAPGIIVMRDTVVLRGGEARRRGRLLQAAAALLAAAMAAFAMILWRLLSLLDSTG